MAKGHICQDCRNKYLLRENKMSETHIKTPKVEINFGKFLKNINKKDENEFIEDLKQSFFLTLFTHLQIYTILEIIGYAKDNESEGLFSFSVDIEYNKKGSND